MLWNVLSGIHNDRWVFCAFAKKRACACGCFGRHTFEVVWAVMAFALRALCFGVYPAIRDDGVPFAESPYKTDKLRAKLANKKLKIFGGCIQKRADWQWYKQAIGLVGWKAEGPSRRICFRCAANETSAPWTDFGLGALWRFTLYSHRTYCDGPH